MIHSHNGTPLTPGRFERNQDIAGSILNELQKKNGEPFVSGKDYPPHMREAYTAESIRIHIETTAAKYGVFLLEHSEAFPIPVIPDKIESI